VREGGHPIGNEASEEVRLLELRVRLVEDDRDRGADLVLQRGGDLLVGALGVGHHACQVLFELGVVVDLEVRALVDAPGEGVVGYLVLPVVGDELRLAGRRRQGRGERRKDQQTSFHGRVPTAAGRGYPGSSAARSRRGSSAGCDPSARSTRTGERPSGPRRRRLLPRAFPCAGKTTSTARTRRSHP